MVLHAINDGIRQASVVDRAEIAIGPVTERDTPRFIKTHDQRALGVGKKGHGIIRPGAKALVETSARIGLLARRRNHMGAAAAADFLSQPTVAIYWMRKRNFGIGNLKFIQQRKKLSRIFNAFNYVSGITVQPAASGQLAQ